MASPRSLPLPSAASSSGQDPSHALGGGLQFEHSLAFQPGMVWLLKVLGMRNSLLNGSEWSPSQAVLLTSLLATLLSAFQPALLYSLTYTLTRDKHHSKMAAYLSILSLAPCSLITPTPESFFSFFALLGHLCLSSSGRFGRFAHVFLGAFCYSLATAFRANGILFIGFILWFLLWQDPKPPRKLSFLCAPFPILICVWPLLLSQSFAFARLCLTEVERKDWCVRTIPSVYSYVQDLYWNVGPFRYWTLAQLPNWLLALPVLSLAAKVVRDDYVKDLPLKIKKTLQPWKSFDENDASIQKMLPHVHFTLITLLILLVTSHIQIILRFASPGGLPAVWWCASQLVLLQHDAKGSMPSLHRLSYPLLPYLVIWNVTSIVLYAGFYPPA